MSENEKLAVEATDAENSAEDAKLTTPQESNPLENESVEISAKENEEKEREEAETAEEVEKETDAKTDENENCANRKMLGGVLAASAVLVLSLGVIGAFGLSNRGAQAKPETKSTDGTSANVTTVLPQSEENYDIAGTFSWWKAGVGEYGFINIDGEMMASTTASDEAEADETTTASETVTTTASSVTTTEKPVTTTVTTTKKPVTTTTVTTTQKKPEYTEEAIEKKTFYLTDNVNFRTGPGTSFKKIKTLKKNTPVVAVAKVSNGWYKVEAGGTEGYVIDDYLTGKKPVTTTTQQTTAPKPETSAPVKDAETGGSPVISYTEEELEMFYYVVEGEVGGCSEKSKLAVANVIINRVKSKRFPNSLKGVLTARGQFTAINNYYSKRRTPTASTIDCVNRAINGEDNSLGALYFYSKKYCSSSTAAWFESLTFCLEVDGQRYFKC